MSGCPALIPTNSNGLNAAAPRQIVQSIYFTVHPVRGVLCILSQVVEFLPARRIREIANCRKQGILRFAEVPRSAAKLGLKTIGDYPRAQSDDERGARRRATNRSRTVNLPSHYRNRVVKLCMLA